MCCDLEPLHCLLHLVKCSLLGTLAIWQQLTSLASVVEPLEVEKEVKNKFSQFAYIKHQIMDIKSCILLEGIFSKNVIMRYHIPVVQ